MSIHNELSLISNKDKVSNAISSNTFNTIKKRNTFFNKYSVKTLYRAYILEYIILLWDNTYSILINNKSRTPKLRGLNTKFLGKDFIYSSGYKRLVELQFFLENNYFNKYAVIRYLTQAWSNYLYNKGEHYTYIPLSRIYSDKVKLQYLELSKSIKDKTIYQDNLSFTNDPVTLALLNYYYYLDINRHDAIVNSFEQSLASCLNDAIRLQYQLVKKENDKALLLHYIMSVGMQKDLFSVNYGYNLILNQNILAFADLNRQIEANNYLVLGKDCDTDITVTLSLSRFDFYKNILSLMCKQQLSCLPISVDKLKFYSKLGLKVTDTNIVLIES
jgi:hypothetical protein